MRLKKTDSLHTVEQPGWGLSNTGPFSDVQSSHYWSGTEYDSFLAWEYDFATGYQNAQGKINAAYAWAVRSGDVPAVVPVPAAVWLFGSGLMGLVGFARRKKVT